MQLFSWAYCLDFGGQANPLFDSWSGHIALLAIGIKALGWESPSPLRMVILRGVPLTNSLGQSEIIAVMSIEIVRISSDLHLCSKPD